MKARRDDKLLTICNECPDQLVLAEVGRDTHSEHAPLPSGLEMRGLTSIRSTRIDSVVGTHRYIQLLFRIAIVVTEKQAEGAVGIFEPAFEGAGDARAGFMQRFERQCLRVQQRTERRSGQEHRYFVK